MTTLSRTAFSLFIALFSLTFLFSQAPQAQAADPAVAFVQGLGNKALSSLTAKDLPTAEREKRVRALLQQNFDVQTIGKFALGRAARTATPAQMKEYQKLFEDMIVKTYARRFSDYSGQSLKVNDSVVKPNDTDTVVKSQIIQPDGPPVSVDWRVRKSGGALRIIDVYVENISMSVTQRSDFGAVIQSSGGNLDGLLDALRERTEAPATEASAKKK